MKKFLNMIQKYYHYRRYKKLLKYKQYSKYGPDYRTVINNYEYLRNRFTLIILRFFYLFPVKKNRVLFMSFEAKKYSEIRLGLQEYFFASDASCW